MGGGAHPPGHRRAHGAALPRLSLSLPADPQELPWVEVLVEILLSLLAQPSHLMRQVARSVFSHICSHLTPRALQLILDVSWAFRETGPRMGPSRHQAAPGLPQHPLILAVTCRVLGGPPS